MYKAFWKIMINFPLFCRNNGSFQCSLRDYELFFCLFFRAEPTAYGGSQAKAWIRAVATGLCHSQSNAGSKPSATYTTACGNTGSLTHWARSGVKPTSSHFHWATMGTPELHDS